MALQLMHIFTFKKLLFFIWIIFFFLDYMVTESNENAGQQDDVQKLLVQNFIFKDFYLTMLIKLRTAADSYWKVIFDT